MKSIYVFIWSLFKIFFGLLIVFSILSTIGHLGREYLDIIEKLLNKKNIFITIPCLLVVVFSYYKLKKMGKVEKDWYKEFIFWK